MALSQYNVRSSPTFLVFKDGALVERMAGTKNFANLPGMITGAKSLTAEAK